MAVLFACRLLKSDVGQRKVTALWFCRVSACPCVPSYRFVSKGTRHGLDR